MFCLRRRLYLIDLYCGKRQLIRRSGRYFRKLNGLKECPLLNVLDIGGGGGEGRGGEIDRIRAVDGSNIRIITRRSLEILKLQTKVQKRELNSNRLLYYASVKRTRKSEVWREHRVTATLYFVDFYCECSL